MITPEFVKYVKQKIAIGFSKEDLMKIVVKSGWTAADLDEAIDAIYNNSPSIAQPVTPKMTRVAPKRTGKKLTLSIGLILVSIVYAFYQNTIPDFYTNFESKSTADSPHGVVTLQTSTPPPSRPNPADLPVAIPSKTQTSSPKPVIKSIPTPKPISKPTPAPAPTPKPQGKYLDGTYIGGSADAYYGTIQVAAIIRNGALADVRFLQYPNDRNTSVRINSRAMPILKQEAISAQSANVNIVSGATDSSQAFQQSMASALARAKNS